MKTVLLFPGQGSQYIGMGAEIYSISNSAKKVFDKADKVLHEDFSKKIFAGSDVFFEDIENTQLSIFLVSVATFEALKEKVPDLQIEIIAGHSLGEYSALYAAGVFNLETGISIVKKRGYFMQQAAIEKKTGMVAIKGESQKKIVEFVNGLNILDLYPSNVNSYNQIVYSGSEESIEKLLANKNEEFSLIPLKVKGGFHSPFMETARVNMHSVLTEQKLRSFKYPVISNIDGNIYESEKQVIEKLEEQIVCPVQWVNTIEKMIDYGVDLLLEVGPGKVLTGLSKKIYKKNHIKANFYNINDSKSFENLPIIN